MIVGWIGLALAGSAAWELGGQAYWVDEALQLRSGVSTWRLEGGYVFPIEQGEQIVGGVFVTNGTWRMSMASPREARATANRLVALEGADAGALRSAVDTGTLELGVDRGWVVGIDVWEESLAEVSPVRRAPGVHLVATEDGSEEVLVTGTRLRWARRVARGLLAERSAWMRAHAFEPGALIALDRQLRALDPALQATWFAEFRTDQVLDRFVGVHDLRAPSSWLSHLDDPRGWLDPRVSSRAYAQRDGVRRDEHHEGVARRDVATRPNASLETGQRAPTDRVDRIAASATVTFDVEPGGSLISRTTADLAIEAVGAPAQVVVVQIPHVHQRAWYEHPGLEPGFGLESATLRDGTPLQLHELPLSPDPTEGRGSVRTFALALPEPLPPGASATLRLRWHDRHRYGRTLLVGPELVVDAGASTRVLQVLPEVLGAAPRGAPVELHVGVSRALPEGIQVASGEQIAGWSDDRYRWRHVRGTMGGPEVAVVAASEREQAGVYQMPRIRTVSPRRADHEGMPVRIRQLIHLSQSVFDPYPLDEVTHARLHRQWGNQLVVSPGGLVSQHDLVRGQSRPAHSQLYALALALHAQRWLALEPDELGVAFAAAGAWATWVMELVHGEEILQDYLRWQRSLAEASRGGVDLEADGVGVGRQQHGAYAGVFFLGRTLEREIGRPQLLAAFEQVFQGKVPPTWEGLQAAAENLARRELDHVFDPFVHAGLAPRIRGAIEDTPDGGCEIVLTANVPFGTLRVPVRVGPEASTIDAVVEIEEGEGRLAIEDRSGRCPGRLQIDPERVLLLERLDTL